jgi:endonuclease/exonuclease/phosphatase family metal-dependent hydrolase
VTTPFTLATFNVKDLFDAKDDAGRVHLDAKLACLAGMLESADADVVALQEVGSLEVTRALCARAARLGYGEPIIGTKDARGIRCAVIGRARVIESRVHTAEHLAFPTFFEGDPPPFGARIPLRRGIVHTRIEARGIGPVELLVGHFKSNRAVPFRDVAGAQVPPVTQRAYAEGHLRSLVWRAAEALFVRTLVDDLLAGDPSRAVVVAGDLNDHPGSHVVRIVCGGGSAALVPCADAVPQPARFSILRHGVGQQIDHVLVTPALRARLQSARFLNEGLRDHGDFDEDAPPTPDSDHAPFVVSFA